jgi:DNA-binding NarL/FixJ family response regulator
VPVAVADDTMLMREGVAQLLTDAGFEVTLTSNLATR